MPGFNNHQTNLMLKKNIFVFAAFFSTLRIGPIPLASLEAPAASFELVDAVLSPEPLFSELLDPHPGLINREKNAARTKMFFLSIRFI